jgi:hypothetical protein
MNKAKSIIIVVCGSALIIILMLSQSADSGGGSIFSSRNIIKAARDFIIAIPIAYVLYKYFYKKKEK